jgi:hypothetical protein
MSTRNQLKESGGSSALTLNPCFYQRKLKSVKECIYGASHQSIINHHQANGMTLF